MRVRAHTDIMMFWGHNTSYVQERYDKTYITYPMYVRVFVYVRIYAHTHTDTQTYTHVCMSFRGHDTSYV